jgi:hypothetical protein
MKIESMKHKVHKFKLKMTEDQDKLELFLNSLEGEIVAIIPNTTTVVTITYVDLVEKVG